MGGGEQFETHKKGNSQALQTISDTQQVTTKFHIEKGKTIEPMPCCYIFSPECVGVSVSEGNNCVHVIVLNCIRHSLVL